jgi:2-oxoglutarate ferredoxin oxidoreductase subunit gamma
MKEFLIGGFGGQGIILMGMILGKAAAVFEGRFATMMQSFGPEARGGACMSQVILSDNPIAYPYVRSADVGIFMNQESYEKYINRLKPEATLIINSDLVTTGHEAKGRPFYSVAANSIAEEMGRIMVANIVMAGFVTAVTGMDKDAVKNSIQDSIRKDLVELNLKAFEKGFEQGAKAVK